MASKIVVFVLIVTVYKVQSQTIYFPNSQSAASSNAKSSAAASSSSSNAQATSNSQATSQAQTLPVQPSNPNQGIKASPQLQIVPGQRCNLQAFPVTQMQGPVQQRGQNQNCGCSIPRPVIQASPSPQIQTSPAQLIQPSLTGPASVITSPVSTISIPPSGVTTIIDNSLSNSLANALQMMIANEFINSAINNNIIKEGIQIPVVETVVPTFDLASFLQGLNAQQIEQVPCQSDPTPQTDASQQFDWTAIKNFLNKQGQEDKTTTAPTTGLSNLMSCFQQYGQTAEQISQQQPSNQETNSQSYSPQQATPASQNIPQSSPDQNAYNSALETLAAYFGCNTSDVSSNTYPTVPQIAFPEEIPAQLICNYGYMPTTVPVVSFSVQPLSSGDSNNNFIVGCQC